MQYSIIRIIQRTLNHVDPRLVDHGKRVAYLVYRAMSRAGSYDAAYIRDVSLLALLHDVGAYKTEEIENMVQFETEHVWEHSVYGYLNIFHFSPLRHISPALFFHHANCEELTHLAPEFRDLAQLLYVADRIDILLAMGHEDPEGHIQRQKGKAFYPHIVDMFLGDDWRGALEQMEEDADFLHMLYDSVTDSEEIAAYLRMMVLLVDFRSPQTVTHSFASTRACLEIARRMDCFSSEEMEELTVSVMLHDLGKVAIPQSILEKPGRLDDEEMETMRTHVTRTEEILSGCIEEKVVRLAVRHHEKLNGSGYPHGLRANVLTPGERLIAVTDIFSALYGSRTYKDSFPKERVLQILSDMVDNHLLDADIVRILAEDYEDITAAVDRGVRPITDTYKVVRREYESLLHLSTTFRHMRGDGRFGAGLMP